MSNLIGKNLTLNIFGESHGTSIGGVITGIPAGIRFNNEELEQQMLRRAPGQMGGTKRKETDKPFIQSGILENKDGCFYTTGMPLAFIIKNNDTNSSDYEQFRAKPRPAHADLAAIKKYGSYVDLRGSGHFSGRLTAPMVVAGFFAGKILEKSEITVRSFIKKIGDIEFSGEPGENFQDTAPFIKESDKIKALEKITSLREKKDSTGGVVLTIIEGLGKPLGGTHFDSIESKIAAAIFGIPAVKAVEFGEGISISQTYGSLVNGEYHYTPDGGVTASYPYGGGIVGGFTVSERVNFTTYFKPTPSIGLPQKTINLKTGENDTLEITGRHDPCVALRGAVVVESISAFVFADLVL